MFTVRAGQEVAESGIHYRGVDQNEIQVSGPAGFAVAPDGSFWILDTAAMRLLHYGKSGYLVRAVDLGDRQRSLTDIEATESAIFVLDAFPTPPLVLRIAPDGEVQEEYQLPEEFRLDKLLTGIGLDGEGNLLLEKEGGVSVFRMLDDQGKVAPVAVEGYAYEGRAYSARPAGIQAEDNTHGHIMMGDRRVEVDTEHFLGSLRILGVGPDGSVYVRLAEMMMTGEMATDQTVRRYGPGGDLLGMARVTWRSNTLTSTRLR